MASKKLYRTKPRLIAGVCSGLADYFNVDPTIVRIVFLLLLIPGGVPGPLVYIVMWIITPEAPRSGSLQQ